MSKIAFVLGAVGSVAAGLLLSSRLVHRDYSATVAVVSVGHPCPTLGVVFDKPPEGLPPQVTSCSCPAAATVDGGSTPIHPPSELAAASASSDAITISYTEFTSPLGGPKKTGLSYTLSKGADRQTWVVSSAWPAYSSFAMLTVAPFLGGIVLAVLLTFLPKKKSGTSAYS